jgi:signal transduction histidine kinase/ActR/RegA family two-component response regulator
MTETPRISYRNTTATAIVVIAALVAWPLFFQRRLASGFHPHGYCYLWDPTLVSLHVISDALIGLSYVAISVTLAYLVYRGREHIPFSWMFLAFGAFIIACGGTHFMEIWTLWVPSFWLHGNVKMITALASVATAVALPPLVPRVLGLVESATVSEDRRQQLDVARRELATLEALQRSEAERAHLLEREQEARAQAEAANRAKDEFLASVSHELRTPLSAMLGWSRILREGTLDATGIRRALDTIERNARAQAQLIEDLLDVSRITTGKLRLDVQWVELAPVIQAVLDTVRPAADAKEIQLQAILDPLPTAISGDPERLQQIVWNLLSNAIKFTPPGGRVQVRLERVNSHVEIIVSDTGVGIDPEFLPYMFERFRQADSSTTRRHRGLGLGLGIVRHLAELHGGTVHAESEGIGQGATFRVLLPLRAVRPAAREGARHPAATRVDVSGQPMLNALHILVVDDEEDARELIGVILSARGARVTLAASAADADRVLSSEPVDAIVCDIEMPEEDGYAFVKRLRTKGAAQGGRVPAVALTAYARVEDRMTALLAGFDSHVPKPADAGELAAVLAVLVRRVQQM